MALEMASWRPPPDGSMWVVESPNDPDDVEGLEIDVKVPDGAARRYVTEHTERLDDGMLSLSLTPTQQQYRTGAG